MDFIMFLSKDKKAKEELVDNRDIDSLSTLIDQKQRLPVLSQKAESCYSFLGGMFVPPFPFSPFPSPAKPFSSFSCSD